MSDDDAALPREPQRPEPRRRLMGRLCILSLASLGVAVVAPAHHAETPDAGGSTAPFSVEGEHVDVRPGSPTWSYLELAHAEVAAPIPSMPMSARVAFDETRAQPIVAPLAGHVDDVKARLGEHVSKDERVIAIRSPDLVDLSKEIEVERAMERAKAKATERLRALVALNAEPSKKLVDAEQEYEQARLARERAELKLRSLSVSTDDASLYWLTAPRDGVVVQRDVVRGLQVGPDRAEPLMVVAELDEVVVTADVPEGDVTDLTLGQAAQVIPAAGSETAIAGRIEYIGEVVDPERRMVEVRVRVPNPEKRLRPNAYVQVAFAPEGEARVVVPSEAVVTDDQHSFIFVPHADGSGTLERREVSLGRQRGGRVEIVRGCAPGETYVSKGAILLLNAVDLANQ
jgi:cobalt-zinc-cadmium efflux system membrane fusion protein